MKRHLSEALLIATVAVVSSYWLGLTLGWVESINWLEAFAVFTSYVCTWLCVRQRRINYPIGAVSTAAYALLFIQNDLVASAILNVYLTPALLYGWYRWRSDENKRPVSHVAAKWVPVYVIATGAFYWGAVKLSEALGGTMAWTDSVVLVATILAQFLLDNKKLETWLVWGVVNVFAIVTYTGAGLFLVAFQYFLFLVNTYIGFRAWRRDHDRLRPDDRTTADDRAPGPDPVR